MQVRIGGVLTRQCSRCQAPLTAILADRGREEDIQPAQVPPIVQRHAQVEPVKKVRKPRQQKPTIRRVV